MKNELLKRKVPLFQEFRPDAYKKNGTYDEYVELMQAVYKGFIDMECDRTYEITQIDAYAKKSKELTNLFFF